MFSLYLTACSTYTIAPTNHLDSTQTIEECRIDTTQTLGDDPTPRDIHITQTLGEGTLNATQTYDVQNSITANETKT